NAEEIGKRAGALFDKVSGFLTSMDKLDKSLFTAQKSFDDAKNQLTSGRGSVVRQVEILQKLGAKNSKQIPAGWDEEGGASTIETAPSHETRKPRKSKVTDDADETEMVLPEFLSSSPPTSSQK
ncbi:MAG TPA: DNA recombination protein RmuC, partial [Devosia sp.]|nr:DNA recombination protein RmuC [Devosia sp.]